MSKEKKIFNSFKDLSDVYGSKDIIEETQKKEKIKKEKPLYCDNDIIAKGTQLTTKDKSYETYSNGSFTSWRLSMVGKKNGAVDVGNNIENGYSHGSFHDKSRAASILVDLINTHKIK